MSKRTFVEIRRNLLSSMKNGKKTINQLASVAGVNWKTTQRHLIFLMGKGFVHEVFSSPYVKIYDLTDKGKEVIKKVEGNNEEEKE